MNEREGLMPKEDGERVFNFRPLFFVAVFLILGILFGYFQKINGVSAWWLCLLLLVLIPPFFFYKHKEKVLLAVAALLLFFALGNILFSIALADFESSTVYEGNVTVLGRVVEIQGSGNWAKVFLDRLYLNENAENGKLIAYLPVAYAEKLLLGDELALTGTIELNSGYSVLRGIDGGGIADRIRYSAFGISDVTVTGHSFDLFLEIRQRMTDGIRLGMDENSAELMIAILLGDTSQVSSGVLQNVRVGGIAHVFAVSGLHVGALYAFCRFVAGKCKFPKILSFFLIFSMVVTYGGVCGYSSSVIRAIVTCLCFYLAGEVGIKSDFMEIIGLAAIVVLLMFPTLLFDVGFQLSYGACLGLSCFSKPFSKAFDRLLFWISTIGKSAAERQALFENRDNLPPTVWGNIKNTIVGAVVSTLAAQTFTLPITVNTFGYLSLLSVPLNCIVVPILVALFPIFLGGVAFVCILPFTAVYLLYLPAVLWHAIILPFEVLDLSQTALSGFEISSGSTLLYCTGLVLLSGKMNLKGWKKWSAVALYFVLFVLAVVLGNL